jgi:hypothetical protein
MKITVTVLHKLHDGTIQLKWCTVAATINLIAKLMLSCVIMGYTEYRGGVMNTIN